MYYYGFDKKNEIVQNYNKCAFYKIAKEDVENLLTTRGIKSKEINQINDDICILTFDKPTYFSILENFESIGIRILPVCTINK